MINSLKNELILRDHQHVWHPCSQMKDYETFPPLVIGSAKGSYFYLKNGQKIIDAISSWWCKSLGHGHPAIIKALTEQMQKFEHVILANTTHELVVTVSEKLAALAPGLDKVMYASDGASAVEIALKMALHAKQLQGQGHKTEFMALANSYHGDTCLALSVGDLGRFKEAYQPLLRKTEFINNIPYVNNKQDPLWNDCSSVWPAIETELNQHKSFLCAIIVEPLLQGSAGMRLYSQDFLRRLHAWAKTNDIYFIADEIFTGIGRTGLPLACHYADITPDFLCLGKSLTSGFLPLSAVVTSNDIYQLFYDDYATGKTFMHSHTHSGNGLALAAALATLLVMEQESLYERARMLESSLSTAMQEVADSTQQLQQVRYLGAMVAADLITPSHLQSKRLGFAVFKEAVKLGAFLRPIGNTIYWVPPFTIEDHTIQQLRDITIKAIKTVFGENSSLC